MTFQLLRRPRATIVPEPVIPGLPYGHSAASTAAAAAPAGHGTPGSSGPWAVKATGPPAPVAELRKPIDSFHNPLDTNHFAKFATIGDALPLWKAAAVELAEYAAQVGAGGGGAAHCWWCWCWEW